MSAHHDHHGSHGHGHTYGHASQGRAFAIGVALNAVFVAVEAGYGIASGSMALVADAGHNLSDVLGLLIAWTADTLSARPPSARFTYGFKSSSILAALANAAMLLAAIGAIGVETIQRFFNPQPVEGGTIMVVAAVGIVINTLTAMMFMRGRHDDMNIKGAFLHMAGDAAVSAAVVVAGLIIMKTGVLWIDPVTSLLILAVIGVSSWGLFKQALKAGLLAVPDSIDHHAVQNFLVAQSGVSAVHDLHIWPMSTRETALTAHLVMADGHPGNAFLHKLAEELEHHFNIDHATMQIETGGGEGCALESAAVV